MTDPVGAELILGHGASGSAASMAPHIAGLASRGIAARAIDLPKGLAERAVPRFADLLAAEGHLAVGGHSFGGRVASLAAAEACAAGRPPRALILLSYPLHAPGRADDWDARTSHWPRLARCPVLVLTGSSDPFVTMSLLERAVAERLPHAVMHVYGGVRHGLGPVLDDALDRVAAFMRDHPAAS
jgi:predicted alpha/beta-hydrolase family hydrolase